MSTSTQERLPVLFILPPGGLTEGFQEHLGAAFLRAVLARSGIKSLQYTPPRPPSPASFAQALLRLQPRIVAFTVYDSNVDGCRALALITRKVCPDTTVIAGGPSCTFSPREVMARVPADACLRGAGEGVIVRLISYLISRERSVFVNELPDVPNLAFHTPEELVFTATASLSSIPDRYFKTLDDIPSPYTSGFISDPGTGILTARGCNQHCTYCSFATISGRAIRFHSLERVLDDIAALKHLYTQVGASTGVPVLDDAFTISPKRAKRICEGIIGKGLQLPFNAMTRADRVDHELLELMKRAGFTGICFGLESAAPHVLRTIGKVLPPQTASDPTFEAEKEYVATFPQAVREAKRAGLDVSVSVIGGLPRESTQDFQTTLDFVKALEVSSYAHNWLEIMPGTPLFEKCSDSGLAVHPMSYGGLYRTRHGFDVKSVPAMPHSSVHQYRLQEANLLVDALCGRSRVDLADEDCSWALVLHNLEVDDALASWVPQVLASHGLILLLNDAGEIDDDHYFAMCRLLRDSEALPRWLSVLHLERNDETGKIYVARRSFGNHQLTIRQSMPSPQDPGIQRRDDGSVAVNIYIVPRDEAIVSDARVSVNNEGAWRNHRAQIADTCRWWGRNARCSHLPVLHADEFRRIRACWDGPFLGLVGEPHSSLRSQAARTLHLNGAVESSLCEARCPMSGDLTQAELDCAHNLELGAQMAWINAAETLVGGNKHR